MQAKHLGWSSRQGDPNQIGKLVSALSNVARLEGKETAFLVEGIEVSAHNAIGTSFYWFFKRVGNQVFELWLRNRIPLLHFSFAARLMKTGNSIVGDTRTQDWSSYVQRCSIYPGRQRYPTTHRRCSPAPAIDRKDSPVFLRVGCHGQLFVR